MKLKARKAVGTALSVVGCGSIVGLFYTVATETPVFIKEYNNLKNKKDKKSVLKAFILSYKKSLVVAGIGITSTVSSRIINNKTEAALASTIMLMQTSYNKYKDTVKKEFGVSADKKIQSAIRQPASKDIPKAENGECLYYEEHIGYFYARPEQLMKAYSMMNEDISRSSNWYAKGYDTSAVFTLKEFLNACEGRALNKHIDDSNLNFGWDSNYLREWYEDYWIHMDISAENSDGVREIYFLESPIWNPHDWYEYISRKLDPSEYWKGCSPKVNKNLVEYTIK